MKPISNYASPFLRIGMSLVFLYFGFQQIYSPDDWTGFIPSFLTSQFLTSANFVVANGIIELTLGMFLLFGIYTRFSSLILAAHLMGITFSIGFTPLGIRDFGLTVATFVIFLYGADSWSIDYFSSRKDTEKKIA